MLITEKNREKLATITEEIFSSVLEAVKNRFEENADILSQDEASLEVNITSEDYPSCVYDYPEDTRTHRDVENFKKLTRKFNASTRTLANDILRDSKSLKELHKFCKEKDAALVYDKKGVDSYYADSSYGNATVIVDTTMPYTNSTDAIKFSRKITCGVSV